MDIIIINLFEHVVILYKSGTGKQSDKKRDFDHSTPGKDKKTSKHANIKYNLYII